MIEVYPNFFVGSESDYETQVARQAGWTVVHACKEPYHRQLLGYSGRGAPKGHPEYLLAERGHRLYLNLVDTHDPAYVATEIVDAALNFIGKGLASGQRTLVHCNQGESRGPSLGLLYLAARTDALPRSTLEAAEAKFRQLYPSYLPKEGMRGFLRLHWIRYVGHGEAS